MSPRGSDDEEADAAGEIAKTIRDLLGDDNRPLTREEAKELERLKEGLPRPPRKAIRELGRSLAKPKGG
jgi:hypothetical protein